MPYNLKDEELPEDWECKHNVWDPNHASCNTAQALSNEEIDGILALQAQGRVAGEVGVGRFMAPTVAQPLPGQHDSLEAAQYEDPSADQAEDEYYPYDGEG